MQDDTQWQIDAGTGELVAYPDPYKNQTAETAEEAQKIENEILIRVGVIETNYLKIGQLLAEFKERKLYLAAGDPDFRTWCNSPKLSRIGYRSAQRLIQIVDKALPLLEKHGAMDILPDLGMSTMADLLPILNDEDGEEKFVEAAYQVRDMTNADAKEAIKEIRGVAKPLDHEMPTVFKAKVRAGEDYMFVRIYATNGPDFYEVTQGKPLMIRKRDWPRWEDRFGRFLEHEDG